MTMTTRLEGQRYLDVLRTDAERLADVAARGCERDVPSCPGWTVEQVVQHVGAVYRHKVACIELGRRPADEEWVTDAPPGSSVVPWFTEQFERLAALLAARGPAAPSFTWWPPDQTVGFWYRRMAQETAVHRVDVESAYDEMTPVDSALAVDGIDEVLTLMLDDDWSGLSAEDWQGVDPQAGAGETILVRTGGLALRTTLAPDRVVVSDDGGAADASARKEADATVTGEPSEVLLWLWGRRPDAAVQLLGNRATARAFRDRLRLATQ